MAGRRKLDCDGLDFFLKGFEMLVLKRRQGQSIWIGETQIQVESIRAGFVCIVVSAKKDKYRLTLPEDQKFRIDSQSKITIAKVATSFVKIGIDADRSVPVHRGQFRKAAG